MLEISPLTLGYRNKPVLDFSGMQLPAGGQCLITGPSGSGKTTLLYAIGGLIDVLAGKIVVDGTDISTLSESARDHFRGAYIGMIFQTLHLVKSLTVIENLMLASYMAGLPQKREYAIKLLSRLGIADKKDDLPQRLSQGQAQRVAIVRSVLHHPRLILADEPTSSLDDASCETVIRLIKQLAQENGSTLIISTHDHRIKSHFSQVITLEGLQ